MPTCSSGLHICLRRLHRLRKSSLARYSTQKGTNPPDEFQNGPSTPWRDSASLILVAPSTAKDPTALPSFMITKRAKESSVGPNLLCFPGGHIDDADCHKKWINLFGMMSGSDIRDVKFLSDSAHIPIIYGRKNQKLEEERLLIDAFKIVPKNVSLRITAIRETFEECGILLCRTSDKNFFGKPLGRDGPYGVGNTANYVVIKNPDELEEWQMQVKKDPMQFHTLCEKLSCFPDVNALVEWSNWLTPSIYGSKRFDTLFYMAIAPIPLPYLIDPSEVATARWTTANDVLKGAIDGKAKIIPPQIYELTRLRNTKLDRLKQLMKMRLQLGIERCCPCYFKCKDGGILAVFPEDDLYPMDYNLEKFEGMRELDSTVDEVRESTSSHHRIEFKTEFDFKLVVNIGPRNGQIYMD